MIDHDKYKGHTKGPWRFEYERLDFCYVQRGMDGGFVVQGTNKIADGKLIADAPLILARLKEVEAIIKEIEAMAYFCSQDGVSNEVRQHQMMLICNKIEALNKAKGGSK